MEYLVSCNPSTGLIGVRTYDHSAFTQGVGEPYVEHDGGIHGEACGEFGEKRGEIMNEQLWSDERIKTTFGDSLLMHGKFVAQLVKQMRDEYEARIAQLEIEKLAIETAAQHVHQAQVERIAELESQLATKPSDEWIPWSSGECPVNPGVVGNILFRCGEVQLDTELSKWEWEGYGEEDEFAIVAYCVKQ